jgi:hypothetical protein
MERNKSKPNYSGEVRQYFRQLPPLTVITSREVYDSPALRFPDLKNHTVREAVQRVSFGSPTTKRRNTKKFYSIYLEIPEIK